MIKICLENAATHLSKMSLNKTLIIVYSILIIVDFDFLYSTRKIRKEARNSALDLRAKDERKIICSHTGMKKSEVTRTLTHFFQFISYFNQKFRKNSKKSLSCFEVKKDVENIGFER